MDDVLLLDERIIYILFGENKVDGEVLRFWDKRFNCIKKKW